MRASGKWPAAPPWTPPWFPHAALPSPCPMKKPSPSLQLRANVARWWALCGTCPTTPGSALGSATAHPLAASHSHGRLPTDKPGPSA
eukprot:5562080-Alexandrium_andersonii.AAC.1